MKYLSILILIVISISCKQKEINNITDTNSSKENVSNFQSQDNTDNTFLFTSNNKQINQVVRTVFQDSKNTLWFGTENGAFKLVNDALVEIDDIKGISGKNVTIKDITESKDGKIWFGHTDGLSSFDGEIIKNYYMSDGLISNDVWCIEADQNGNIWIGTTSGVSKFNGKHFSHFQLPEGKTDTDFGISTPKMVHQINEDKNGVIWLSTNAGLFSYANKTLTNASKKLGITTNFINQTFEDNKGQLWASAKDGLYKISDNSAKNITKSKLTYGKGLGSVAEDKNGTLWFVANQHFLYSYDGKSLTEFIKTKDNKGPVIFKIYKDLKDRMWYVGFGGAYRLENLTFINITENGPW